MGDVARVQVVLPYSSGVPSDVVTNTWHFESLDGESITSAKLASLFTVLTTFYNSVYASSAIKGMASYINSSQVLMKAYNLADPKPRTAVRESVTPLTLTSQESGTIPAEAAIVLSYRTAFSSGIPKASQRGRIYLGALASTFFEAGTASNSTRVKQASREAICNAAGTMAAAALVQKWGWVVWSDKRSQKFAVAGGWVDNAIDTQRRRGQAATTRSTFTS